jgi:hypothetical protein
MAGKRLAMVNEQTQRCEHLACLCEVTFEEATCSPYCASPDGRDPQNITCACGHPACAKAIDEQLHGGAGSESAT